MEKSSNCNQNDRADLGIPSVDMTSGYPNICSNEKRRGSMKSLCDFASLWVSSVSEKLDASKLSNTTMCPLVSASSMYNTPPVSPITVKSQSKKKSLVEKKSTKKISFMDASSLHSRSAILPVSSNSPTCKDSLNLNEMKPTRDTPILTSETSEYSNDRRNRSHSSDTGESSLSSSEENSKKEGLFMVYPTMSKRSGTSCNKFKVDYCCTGSSPSQHSITHPTLGCQKISFNNKGRSFSTELNDEKNEDGSNNGSRSIVSLLSMRERWAFTNLLSDEFNSTTDEVNINNEMTGSNSISVLCSPTLSSGMSDYAAEEDMFLRDQDSRHSFDIISKEQVDFPFISLWSTTENTVSKEQDLLIRRRKSFRNARMETIRQKSYRRQFVRDIQSSLSSTISSTQGTAHCTASQADEGFHMQNNTKRKISLAQNKQFLTNNMGVSHDRSLNSVDISTEFSLERGNSIYNMLLQKVYKEGMMRLIGNCASRGKLVDRASFHDLLKPIVRNKIVTLPDWEEEKRFLYSSKKSRNSIRRLSTLSLDSANVNSALSSTLVEMPRSVQLYNTRARSLKFDVLDSLMRRISLSCETLSENETNSRSILYEQEYMSFVKLFIIADLNWLRVQIAQTESFLRASLYRCEATARELLFCESKAFVNYSDSQNSGFYSIQRKRLTMEQISTAFSEFEHRERQLIESLQGSNLKNLLSAPISKEVVKNVPSLSLRLHGSERKLTRHGSVRKSFTPTSFDIFSSTPNLFTNLLKESRFFSKSNRRSSKAPQTPSFSQAPRSYLHRAASVDEKALSKTSSFNTSSAACLVTSKSMHTPPLFSLEHGVIQTSSNFNEVHFVMQGETRTAAERSTGEKCSLLITDNEPNVICQEVEKREVLSSRAKWSTLDKRDKSKVCKLFAETTPELKCNRTCLSGEGGKDENTVVVQQNAAPKT